MSAQGPSWDRHPACPEGAFNRENRGVTVSHFGSLHRSGGTPDPRYSARLSNPVQIDLPPGTGEDITITVQARNFAEDVPVRVVVTPENGPATSYQTNIVMAANPSSIQLTVAIPGGTVSRIRAWTR